MSTAEFSEKTVKKTLTNSGGGVCMLAFLAMLFSVCTALLEVIAVQLYNRFYSNRITFIYANTPYEYIKLYETGIIMSMLSVVTAVWAFSSAKKKKLGREFSVVNMFLPPAICIMPAVKVFSLVTGKAFSDAFSFGSDGDKFRMAVKLLCSALPVLAGIMLFAAGFAVLGKLSAESFSVEISSAGEKKVRESDFFPKASPVSANFVSADISSQAEPKIKADNQQSAPSPVEKSVALENSSSSAVIPDTNSSDLSFSPAAEVITEQNEVKENSANIENAPDNKTENTEEKVI